MADIAKAYVFLNEALGLGLDHEQMSAMERMFKTKLAQEQGFGLSEEDAGNVEAFIYFRPRQGVSLRTAINVEVREEKKQEDPGASGRPANEA